jgi:CheY-like chemotaxis protein
MVSMRLLGSNYCPIRVHAFLLVEDEDAIAVAFRASDVEQAMEYLYSNQHPDLVFLDLNMPGVTGWELFRTVRADESLRPIPVVIFATSSCPADIEQAHAPGAQHFVTKPSTFLGRVVEIETAYRGFVGGNASLAIVGGG